MDELVEVKSCALDLRDAIQNVPDFESDPLLVTMLQQLNVVLSLEKFKKIDICRE